MNTRILTTLLLAGGLLGLAYAFAQPRAEAQPAGQAGDAGAAIRAASEAYTAAFNKGDLAGVLAVWSANPEYVDETGAVTQGREAVSARFKESLGALKGWTLRLEGKSLRTLSPTVAVVDGVAELTSPEGEKETSAYTTIWTQQDGKWLLSSVRDLSPPEGPAADTAHGIELLKDLDWLVGEWSHKDGVAEVTLSCKRALNHFLHFQYTVKTADGSQEVSQWVGYDPQEDSLRSWTFDSTGGFGDGLWSKRGKVWRTRNIGVLPNGQDGEATNSIKPIDGNSFWWKSEGRFVGDDNLPDTEVKFTRVAK